MKTRNIKEEATQEGACCGPVSNKSTAELNEPCCAQPEDGSSCCDKSAPKEVNSEKTGCC